MKDSPVGPPKPITAPCGSLSGLAARSGTSAGISLLGAPLAQPRGNLGFPDDPSAQRRRGIAPKKYRDVQHPHRSTGAHGRCSLDQLRCLVPRVRPVKGGRLGFTTLLTGAIGAVGRP